MGPFRVQNYPFTVFHFASQTIRVLAGFLLYLKFVCQFLVGLLGGRVELGVHEAGVAV